MYHFTLLMAKKPPKKAKLRHRLIIDALRCRPVKKNLLKNLDN